MANYIASGRLKVANILHDFIENEALLNSGVTSEDFWNGFEQLLVSLTPKNKALLKTRDELQAKIDKFNVEQKGADFKTYKQFLHEIGYLVSDRQSHTIQTQNVDQEIATMAGPQLVVPINNARYALNAVNARWGSLYDALYGTDVISEDDGADKTSGYNPVRGEKVVQKARQILDSIAPLSSGSHAASRAYKVVDDNLIVTLDSGEDVSLSTPTQFVGFKGNKQQPTNILLEHNGLHADILIDKQDPIGQHDLAGVKDVVMESALTTIMDCEDSVAAVDAEDKTLVYQNWLGLMRGNLSVTMQKGERTITREMAEDRVYTSTDNNPLTLSGRSLMFIRNVGHLMQNDAILLDEEPIFEGLMDAVITSLIAKQDLLNNGKYSNSDTGSVYIVKPKMHGPDEVAFTNELFSAVENVIGLPSNTLKIGIMDEERRTSVNLAACIGSAKDRVVFINTGFLDRTGDEIHTSMLLGPFAMKADLKQRKWINAYEKSNVKIGLDCGLSGRAQIGKGMWPIPDQMRNMLDAKIGHPQAGANTAWVPSPTAATLHALHYHQVNVFECQKQLATDPKDYLDDILDIPLLDDPSSLTAEQIQHELDNNVQGILGYVVRWVHQGIGCSKVPDINNVGLMEDRATLRISSQHITNWLTHGLVSESQVDETLTRMAKLVDKQNASDPEYIAMTPDLETSIGYQAARDLIMLGKEQPNGYTEPLLHERRKQMKTRLAQ